MPNDWQEVPVDDWQEIKKEKPQPFNANETVDGVPKWGRDNPSLYAGVETGLDLLPMIAGAAKSTGIGIPVAGALNAAGKYAQRKIAGQDTTLGDVAGDFGIGMVGEGAGRGVASLVKGVTDTPWMREKINNGANRIIRSAGKFGTGAGLTPTEQKAMAETVLNKGYKFNENSWQDLLNTIKSNSGKVDDIYSAATEAGDTLTAPEVLAQGDFASLLKRGKDVRGVAPDYTGRVNNVVDTFKKGAAGEPEKTIESAILGYDGKPATTTTIPAEPTPYNPTELNVAKRQIYQDMGNAYKNHAVNDATETAQKTMASAIKKTLDERYPGAVPYNMDSHELLQLEPYFARAINRISQRDAVGLGEKIALGSLKDPGSLADITPGKLGQMIAVVWDRPEIKSRVAQMMYKAHTGKNLPIGQWQKGLKYMGQVAAPAIRTALEAEMYTSDPLGIR